MSRELEVIEADILMNGVDDWAHVLDVVAAVRLATHSAGELSEGEALRRGLPAIKRLLRSGLVEIGDAALDFHPWPGTVEQIERRLDQAVAAAPSPLLPSHICWIANTPPGDDRGNALYDTRDKIMRVVLAAGVYGPVDFRRILDQARRCLRDSSALREVFTTDTPACSLGLSAIVTLTPDRARVGEMTDGAFIPWAGEWHEVRTRILRSVVLADDPVTVVDPFFVQNSPLGDKEGRVLIASRPPE